jgi:hypothetical protein
LKKISFYLSLLFVRFFQSYLRFRCSKVRQTQIYELDNLSKKQIFFWIPHSTAGSKFIVEEMFHRLSSTLKLSRGEYHLSLGRDLPVSNPDMLICFKAIPTQQYSGNKKTHTVLLVCDELEKFWDHLNLFDHIIVTSSFELYSLCKMRHRSVNFITEFETDESLAFGSRNLKESPLRKRFGIAWHGGHYSLPALVKIRPVLETFGRSLKNNLVLNLVSGDGQFAVFHWGELKVNHYPWSESNMQLVAANSRVGIVPARPSIRTSFLKPSSRVRKLYALGVPAIGDANVPEVMRFLKEINGPIARNPKDWLNQLDRLWFHDDPTSVTVDGIELIREKHSVQRCVDQWISFFQSALK